jgi:hypothetical protein
VISFLKPLNRYILHLLMLNILLITAGYTISTLGIINVLFSDILILDISFLLIAIITAFIFFRGQTKDPESQTLHNLVSLSLKFLLELLLAVIWFIIAKKSSLQSVILYFVIYLTLTLFLIWVMLKTLKYRVL